MTEFTPGPWKLIWHSNATYPFPLSVHTEDDSNWIARDGIISSEANARLIAASPDLIVALIEMMREFEPDQADYDDGENYNPPDWLVLARAAIAKARNQ